jgi:hypothetical protein
VFGKNEKNGRKGLITPEKSLICAPRSGSLAQLVEQLAFNQLVDGSNPSRPTIIQDLLQSRSFFCLFFTSDSSLPASSLVLRRFLPCCQAIHQSLK